MSQAGTATPSMSSHSPYAVEDLPLDRAEREVEAVAEEGGERRVAVDGRPGSASPSAQIVRASQYDSPLSDGSGSSTGSALGLSVPSGCIHNTTLPALGPSAVCR